MSPAIVKLGGSLAAARTILPWLATVLENGRGSAVVVPGGGVFADAVRVFQRETGISDGAAHRMALLAMEQYGMALADLAPGLVLAETEGEIAEVLAAGAVAVWRPCRLALADPSVAESWDVTSDSLAAWLAGRLSAARLVLVKSAPAPPPPLSPERLASLGLVDPGFPIYLAASSAELVYCGPGDEHRLAAALGSR